jgi:hypothetical protein
VIDASHVIANFISKHELRHFSMSNKPITVFLLKNYPKPLMKQLLFIILTASSLIAYSQKTDKELEKILKKSGKFDAVLNTDKYEVQILYTQIDRDAQNRPTFKTLTYNSDPNRYFYPASTVKFPAVLLAFEKLNQLKIKGLDKNTPLTISKAFEEHEAVSSDSTSANGKASIGHFAKKILLVSDNDAYNRLYEFVGQQDFNDKLFSKGYRNTRIIHRLSTPYSIEQNKITPAFSFGGGSSSPKLPNYANQIDRMEVYSPSAIYSQPIVTNKTKNYIPTTPIKKGIGYMKGDKLVNEPFDFTSKNFFPLDEQQEILKAVMFPEAVSPQKRFDLSKEDYDFLYQYMSQLPSETAYPKYDPKEFYDSYCKFTMFGDSKNPMPKNIRIFNKVGDAYGFLLDNAYVVDFDKKIEFMLTAVVYCNSDGVFNDDKYDYDTIGFPFYANLGKVIYEYESKRKKKNLPDLSRFKVKYDD